MVPSICRAGLLLTVFVTASGATPERVHVQLTVEVPENTPTPSTLFVTGDFQDWNPGDPDFALREIRDGIHAIELELVRDRLVEFRLTRGSWKTVEAGPHGEQAPPRRLRPTGDLALDLRVAAWSDLGIERTLTGHVSEHVVAGFLEDRRIWVWLPPGYSDGARSYPVVYLLDGQNVFDESTSFAGEWRADETAQALVRAGEIEPLVMVAIDNAGEDRLSEYTPFVDAGRGEGGGAYAFLRAVVDELIPWVEDRYRVETGPSSTGLIGSSLGGLLALYAAAEHSEHFGRIGAVSPSLWWADRAILDVLEERPLPDVRLWVDMGRLEGADAVEDLRQLRERLERSPSRSAMELKVFLDPEGRHHESAWAQRLPRILRFLFPGPALDR